MPVDSSTAAFRALLPKPLPSEHPLDGIGLGAVVDLIPAPMIDEVIAECGRQEQRVRVLPARVALYFTLALWFCPGQGYSEVLRVLFRQLRSHLRAGQWRVPTVSAAVKARHRLGREPLKALFRRLRGPHADTTEPGMSVFGLDVALLNVSVDGTCLDVADTAANRAAFGDPPRNGKGATGPFPKIRLLTLIASGTRTIIDAAWGPFATGELSLFAKLVRMGALRPGMLVLADRYFSGHPQIAQMIAAGAELIVRVQNNRRLPVVTELHDGSYLSILPTANLPTKGDLHRAGGKCRRLGLRKRQERGLRVRVINAEVTVIGEHGETRTESYLLITTLLDPVAAPAGTIAELYHERWESETGFADLKTYLRGPQRILRSKSPNGVAQELYALLIVYQLVQITRCRAARTHPDHVGLDPDRVSFTVTLRALVRSIGENALAAGHLLQDVFDEVWRQPLLERRARTKPRELKGTPAFTRAIKRTPPGPVAYKITTRQAPATA